VALRRLINMITGLAVNRDPQSIRNDTQMNVRTDTQRGDAAFLEQATVQSALQSSCVVTWRGFTTTASLATDEPLQAGMQVWVIKADDGTLLIVGSVK